MGLGCRSGGYLIYVVIAIGLLIIELVVWWLTHKRDLTPGVPNSQTSSGSEKNGNSRTDPVTEPVSQAWARLQHLRQQTDLKSVIRTCIIRPGEIINSVWLVYIIAAQTFGSYQTCECLASTWAGYGVLPPSPIQYMQKRTNANIGIHRLRKVRCPTSHIVPCTIS